MNATNSGIISQSIDIIDSILKGITTKLVVAVIILLLGFVFGKLIGKLLQRFLSDINLDKIVKKIAGMRIPVEEVLSGIVTYFIYFIAVIMALDQMGLTSDILNIISASVMVVIIISVFLGIKDFVPNIISGIIIHNKNFLRNGDWIRIENIEGKIIEISLIDTKVETQNKDLINIPNSYITKNKVVKLNK